MQYKIIPILMIIISTILSILAFSNLNIGDGYVQAPAVWLFFAIWSLTIASVISYFICKILTKKWHKAIALIVQLVITLVLYLVFLSMIPWAFTSSLKDNYKTKLIFRPIAHVIQAPIISVSIVEEKQPRTELKQEIHFWGFWGYSKTPDWKAARYISSPENDPTTLEYALYTGNKTEFISKFQALLDARFDSVISRNLKPLVIDNNKIADNIMKLLPKKASYNAVDVMLAFGELDLLEKISGALSTETKWLNGAIFIDLEGNQLYHYYRLAKNNNKIRFLRSRYDRFYYAGDYFFYAVLYCDSELTNDLVNYQNKPKAAYLVLAMSNLSLLSNDSSAYFACLNNLKTLTDHLPFETFSQNATGKQKFDFFGRGFSDVGLAVRYNGVDISSSYNSQLEALQQKSPEAYNYMIEKGYTSIEQPKE